MYGISQIYWKTGIWLKIHTCLVNIHQQNTHHIWTMIPPWIKSHPTYILIIHKYQPLVDSIWWYISIGRLGDAASVTSVSSFCSTPCQCHLEWAKRVIGYLAKIKYGITYFCTDTPEYSDILHLEHDWETCVYDYPSEALLHDDPISLGTIIILTHSVDTKFSIISLPTVQSMTFSTSSVTLP